MAVPYEEPGSIEPRPHPRDLAGVGDDRVLEAALPRLRRPSATARQVRVRIQRLPVHDLEVDLVDMDRVRVLPVIPISG